METAEARSVFLGVPPRSRRRGEEAADIVESMETAQDDFHHAGAHRDRAPAPAVRACARRRQAGKLAVVGAEVSLDRSRAGQVARARHWSGNAVDHGLELPSARGQGNTRRRARHPRGAAGATCRFIVIEVSDDGAGGLEQIREAALRGRWCPRKSWEHVHPAAHQLFSARLLHQDRGDGVLRARVGLEVVRNQIPGAPGAWRCRALPVRAPIRPHAAPDLGSLTGAGGPCCRETPARLPMGP